MTTRTPKLGAMAPDFTLPSQDQGPVTLSGLRGRYVVLFFYPKDDTSGCTIEGLEFTALRAEFDALNAEVFGISRDTIASHEKFCTKHGLGVSLLSDEDGAACTAYGVWQEKSMYGKKFMGIVRSTFLIDPQGQIVAEWRKLSAPGHAAEVLEKLRHLQAPTLG